ncbi:MAG TPA: DUF1330 domain-containing protein [Gemmatimonadales bacterium]|nr:DUF1330 domain-containing protein [Gemmatimonadales bacterium]
MAAYLIVDIKVNDPVRYEEYRQLVSPTLAAYDGKYLARGGEVKVLEGDLAPNRTVVVEFPTVERALEWWDSDVYRPIRQLRYDSADSKMLLVQGI